MLSALFSFRVATEFGQFLLQPFGTIGEPLRSHQDFVDAGIALFVVMLVVPSRFRHRQPWLQRNSAITAGSSVLHYLCGGCFRRGVDLVTD